MQMWREANVIAYKSNVVRITQPFFYRILVCRRHEDRARFSFATNCRSGIDNLSRKAASDAYFQLPYQCYFHGLVYTGVRSNIHLGGQTEFCPNGERKLFVTRPRQGEKNNNELLQSLF